MIGIFVVIQGMCDCIDGQSHEQFKESVLSKARAFDDANLRSTNKRTASDITDHYKMFKTGIKRRKRKLTVCDRTLQKDEIARTCSLHGNISITCPFCHPYDANASPPCDCNYCNYMRGVVESRAQIDL